MNKSELIESINKELDLNPYSYQHNVDCWAKLINTFPENSQAIIDFFYNDYFPAYKDLTIDREHIPRPVMAALAESKYFNNIIFKNGNPTSHPLDSIVNFFLRDHYMECFEHPFQDFLLRLNSYFEQTVSDSIFWEKLLIVELNFDDTNPNFIKNVIDLKFHKVMRVNIKSKFQKLNFSFESHHYFKIISLGISISSEKLLDKIINGKFVLLNDDVWRNELNYFYSHKDLSINLKKKYESFEIQNLLKQHLEELTSNSAFMVLVFIK
jgi:hypothetical protein